MGTFHRSRVRFRVPTLKGWSLLGGRCVALPFPQIPVLKGTRPKQSGSLLQQHPDPPTDSPARRCLCDLTAVQKTVQKEGANKGRQFWSCPNHESARCKFFEWDDEPPRNDMGIGGGSTSGGFGGGLGIQNGAGDGGGAGECFRCGEIGHWSNGGSPSSKI
jgi:hypothetical protein